MRVRWSKVAVSLLLTLGALVSLVPFFWLIRSSFMSMLEIYTMPPLIWATKPSWANYRTVLFAEVPFFRYILNSIIVVVPVIVGTVLSSSISAYGFSRFRFPLRGMWFALTLSTMMIPGAVTLIPGFLIWQKLGLVNTYGPLIIPSFFGGGAFNIFLFRQFFLTIPRDLDESARIDGAGFLRVYWRILMPLLRPVIVVVGLFTFMNAWNDFFGPLLILYDMKKYTVALGLQLFTSAYGSDYGAVMASAVLMTLPTVIIFFVGQKNFVEGIVTTGLKV